MRIILFIIRSFCYLILFFSFIFLALFPTDEYWNLISTVFYWLIGIGYLTKIFSRSIPIDQVMKHGLICFMIGVVISTLGIFVAGEILLKLSFLLFSLGVIWSFINYKNEKI